MAQSSWEHPLDGYFKGLYERHKAAPKGSLEAPPPPGAFFLCVCGCFEFISVWPRARACACPVSMAPLRARPSVCEISLSAGGCVHHPNDTRPRPGAPPRPAMRYGGSASTSSLLLHANGGRGGSGDQVRVGFMIRTGDAMDRIVGGSQPRIRFLS